MTWPDRLLKWIEPEDNPRNTDYGTIAAGLVIAAADPATATYPRIIEATVVAVATYWVAHGYAHWLAERFRRGAAPESARSPPGSSTPCSTNGRSPRGRPFRSPPCSSPGQPTRH